MDSNHHATLINHLEDEIKPKLTCAEHWIPDALGVHRKLLPGHMFPEKMECDDFNEKTLIKLNNRMRKKVWNS